MVDSYPPVARVRALSAYGAIGTFGNILAPGLVGILASFAGLTWRSVFLSLGLASILLTLVALRLRDPGFGRWDTEQLRANVRTAHGAAADRDDLRAEDVALGF